VATLADIHLNNRPNLGPSKPVDNRPARANTTMVNVDSQMSGITGGRVFFRALHGRTPRGPLAVLKETWTGERDVPVSLGKSVEAYMEELRDKLETAANFSDDHAQRAQASYAARYNLRARDKRFHVGD